MNISIPIPIYSTKVIVVTEKSKCGASYMTTEDGLDNHVVIVNCEMTNDNIYCHTFLRCLSHELNHAAMCILGARGISFDYNNQESLCYLQDYLMSETLDKIVIKTNKANSNE